MSNAVMEMTVESKEESVVATTSLTNAYVIVGDIVGAWKKGRVVAEHEFPQGTDFDRLILCEPQAIRPAMANEVPGTFVDAATALKPGKTLTQQLGDLQDQVVRLSSKNNRLTEELETVKKNKSDAYDPERDEKNMRQTEKYRQAILVLEQQNKAHLATIDDLRKKLNEKTSKR